MGKLIAILLTTAALAYAQEKKPSEGLRVTFKANSATDTLATPHIALYVPEGQPVTPFLPPGCFTAIWEGSVNIDLRGDYSFQAKGKGSIKLEVNNVVLLNLSDLGALGKPATTKMVRLNKGANAIKITYTSPARGVAQLRLFWSDRPDKPMPHEPIPNDRLTHRPTPVLAQSRLRRQGHELFLESRCIRCHQGANKGGIPELTMSSPSFADIGERRHPDWMAQWMLNPKAHRASARMPRLLNGKTAATDAQAIASYLTKLKSKPAPATIKFPKPDFQAAEELVSKLNCIGCHNLPGAKKPAKNKLNLDHINQKFPAGQLRDFLFAPDAHFEWTRMPKFNLTAGEAWNVASWLRSKAPDQQPKAHDVSRQELARGKELLSTIGCLNCHNLKDPNKFKAPNLAALTPDKWNTGCLADEPAVDSRAPRYNFSANDRAALRAFATTDRQSLQRHVPVEFVARQLRLLNCNACHGELEGFPALDFLGAKLKPEWTQQLFAGKLKQRPRPWIPHRMPAFPARAAQLAHGLAMSHGLPPVSPKPKPVNPQLASVGRKLVGVDGGFSCVACHGVKNHEPLQVFEAQGVNFARVGARMQPDYFLRWMLDPLRVNPQSRMPDYFDEDARSVLVDVLEGDAKKQIEAIRQYLLQGNKMKIPVMQ